MTDLLKLIPSWFLIFIIIVMGGAFIGVLDHVGKFLVASLNKSFEGLNRNLDEFKRLIEKLFEKHEDHESRLSRLEGEHAIRHSRP